VNQTEKLPQTGYKQSRTDFKTSIDNPFMYPGLPPEYSFTTDGVDVLKTTVSVDEDSNEVKFAITDPKTGMMTNLDDYLEQMNLPKMGDRIPVIAYGANANPGSLFNKFNYAKEGDLSLLVVPVIKATRVGSEIAWSKKLGARGRQYADMVTNEDVANTEVSIAVNFLTHDQLAIMHSTEKEYDIVEQGEVTLEGGVTIPGFYYSATNGEVYGLDGKPVALSAIKSKNRIGEQHTAESSLQSVIDKLDLGTTAEEFMEVYQSLTDKEKTDVREKVYNLMEEGGFSYAHERPSDAKVHEWSFNSLPTFNQLMYGYEYTGVQGRLFTNDLIVNAVKRSLVEKVLRR